MPSKPNRAGSLRFAGAIVLLALTVPSVARASSVALRWTAPGDDGNTGRASAYELRYSESTVPSDTASWWSSASSAGALPAPLTAGSGQSYTVAGLDSGATYYFIIRTADEVPNWSGFSNVAVKSTSTGGTPLPMPGGFAAQNVTGGVRLSWNAVTSGSPTGFHIYRRTGSSSISVLVQTAPLSQTSWTDSAVSAGITYGYSITTYLGGTESSPATATVTIPGGSPAVVSTPILAYPNPAKGRVSIRFVAGAADGSPGRARLVIYDLTGHSVARLLDDVLPAGERIVDWSCVSDAGNAVAPGLYQAILDTPMGRQVTRLAIVP